MKERDLTKFTVRLHPEVAQKLRYIADYYGRSTNKQIDWLAKRCIVEFEKEHGKIERKEDA